MLNLDQLSVGFLDEDVKSRAQYKEDPPYIAREGRQLSASVPQSLLIEDLGALQSFQDDLTYLILIIAFESDFGVAHPGKSPLLQKLGKVHGVSYRDQH